jgi:uncharacterized protein YbjT (DUF2867 family)
MKILVVGGSQGTGALVVENALARGHEVTVFSRNPSKLVLQHPKLKRLAGDFHQKASVDEAVVGHDAVVITASATSLKAFKQNPNYFSQGTGLVIEAMKTHGVKRLSVLSALGVGDSRVLSNFLVRTLMIGFLLRLPFEDHERQEKQVMASGLDWTIVRPGRLTNGPATKKYVKTAALEKVPMSISRADVADFLVEVVEVDTWIRKAVQIGK